MGCLNVYIGCSDEVIRVQVPRGNIRILHSVSFRNARFVILLSHLCAIRRELQHQATLLQG